MGYLYKTPLNPTNRDDYDEEGNPIMDRLTNAELACMSLVKRTFGVKLESKTKDIWKNDAVRLFRGGAIAVCGGMVLALSAIVVAILVRRKTP